MARSRGIIYGNSTRNNVGIGKNTEEVKFNQGTWQHLSRLLFMGHVGRVSI